jgi:hypothetical protein
MPFLGVDSWRWQYFEHQPVPDGLVIPIDDATAWELYPAHRWVYNKLLICETQGLPHGPHGTLPKSYPVFSKPIYNMRGMGTGGRVVHAEEEYLAALEPGHLWMPYFTGPHVSTDVALLDGAPRWWRHTTGKPGPEGTFDYWTVHAAPDPVLEGYLGEWVARNLAGFTGMVNFETIGGRILECHLRMAEQWLDLNGVGWLEAVVELYATGRWHFADPQREGYSVVLFGPHELHWTIDREAVRGLLGRPGISSIQITFEEDKDPAHHAMPPGGFRLAIVNCWDLEAGLAVREELSHLFVAREAAMAAAHS